jgi:hypothetical protein
MKETKVRVRLDTRQAKGEMREVRKEGERTAGSISEGLSATIRRGFAMTGAGAAFAGGVGAARAAVSGGVGDAFGGAFSMLSASLNDYLLGSIDDEQRAIRSARDQTIEAFAPVAGMLNGVPPEAQQFFQTIKTLEFEKEKGRSLIMGDPAFQGAGFVDIFAQMGEQIGDRLANAIIEKLEPMRQYIPSWMLR